MARLRLEDKKRTVVQKDSYIEELEAEVEKYLRISPVLPKNKILYKRTKASKFKSKQAKIAWENEEIMRCTIGHNGLSPKMYFYFNYGWIQNLSGGKIAPDFRVVDNEWFKLVHECQDSHEWGIVCVKRRRVGMSWKESADVLHDVLFTPFFMVGMNSMSERDSLLLFKKVKFMYDNLPEFLRVRARSKTKSQIDLSYIDVGTKAVSGNQSNITVVSPTDSAFEGWMLNKWVCDEAGKIPNLPQMWSYTEDCLMEETLRVGLPILFGTSGDIGKDGAGLKEMWDNWEVYKLKRFFFAGWMGLGADKYGNDDREELIRWIIYQRHIRKKLNAKSYADFLQKYPLTVEEAFAQVSTGGLGDLIKIHAQVDSLTINPPRAARGRFALNANEEVIFKPDPLGECIIYEYAKKGMDKLYIAGGDPADHDDALPGASNLSMFIMRKQFGMDVPRIVFEYTARPRYLVDYYEQALLALSYYNNCRILIERNRYRMIEHFENAGMKKLLLSAPQGIMRVTRGRVDVIGVHMTESLKEYGEALVEEYIDSYSDQIPSVELLKEMPKYGANNTDRVMALMMVLFQLKEERMSARRAGNNEINLSLPRFRYVNKNGVIQRVSQ